MSRTESSKSPIREGMNVPNRLTLLRMLLIPVIVILILLEKYPPAAILFAVASATDFLDGYLARKNNIVTTFGKFLDPVADKLLVLSSMIMLSAARVCACEGECVCGGLPVTIPAWLVCAVAARDLLIDGLRMISASGGTVIAAGPFGKIKTVLQLLTVISLLLRLPAVLSVILMVLMGIMTLISGADYLIKGKKVFTDSKE